MEFKEVIETVLKDNRFIQVGETRTYVKGKYDITFTDDFNCEIRYKAKVKKDDKQEVIVRIKYFDGLVKSGIALEEIIKAVCYEREN